MRLQVSKSLALTSGQLIVNLFLGSWLVSEYLHNQFMQQYLSNLWNANSTMISTAIATVAVAVSGSYYAIFRRMGIDQSDVATSDDPSSTKTLTALDTCPVCNKALKELSPSRFQCRNCHRYFKK